MKSRSLLTGFLIIGALFLLFILAVIAIAFLFGKGDLLPGGSKIAVVEIQGAISDSRQVVEEIERFRKNHRVKGIVLRIESPGGGVGAAQEIYSAVKRASEQKAVVASLGSVAASGGYYIACGAEKIVANPGTITGSIGVLVEIANIEELLKKVGLKSEVIKSGKHKDMGSPFRQMSPEDRMLLQAVVDDIHAQFIHVVAEGRNMPVEKVKALSDGRIFSGKQAKALGLVDSLGDLNDAIDLAAKMAKIEGEPDVIYSKPGGFSLLDLLIDSFVDKFFQKLEKKRFQVSYRYIP